MDESMAYQASAQQLPAAQPPQPSNPQHGTHGLSNGPQPGTAPATQHSQAGAPTGQTYGPHSYSEPAKPKKGQQLWTRMKRELADLWGSEGWAGPLSGCCDTSLSLGVGERLLWKGCAHVRDLLQSLAIVNVWGRA